LARQAFDTNYGLFMVTQDQLLYPNSSKYAREREYRSCLCHTLITHILTGISATQLAFFEFLGLIIGKALYEGILVEAAFAGFFLSKCLGKMNYCKFNFHTYHTYAREHKFGLLTNLTVDDLPSLDYELYKGLINLKNYDGNVEDLCLDFSITDNGKWICKQSFLQHLYCILIYIIRPGVL
jgi:ubiquitin-protein ligase E3 C